MAFKVTCPSCDAVLRPTKPLTVGQKVKCPKCGKGFAYEGEAPEAAKPAGKKPPVARRDVQTSILPTVDDIDLPDQKVKPGATKPASGAKRAETKTTELPQMEKKLDDSDEIVTYSFRDEGQQVANEEAKINYSQDTSVKDLRGPAAELVVGPSNKLIFAGGMGFLGWFALWSFLIWPVIFPLESDGAPTEGLTVTPALGYVANNGDPPEAGKVSTDDAGSLYNVNGTDLKKLMARTITMMLVCVMCFFGMAWCGVIAVGAVKMQNLESRVWGIVSAIMVIIPVNFGGIMIFTFIAMLFAFGDPNQDPPVFMPMFSNLIEWGTNVGLGAYTIYVLTRQDVIDGFDYVPDT